MCWTKECIGEGIVEYHTEGGAMSGKKYSADSNSRRTSIAEDFSDSSCLLQSMISGAFNFYCSSDRGRPFIDDS